MKAVKINRIGERYGKLVVVGDATVAGDRGAVWECQCDCGVRINVLGYRLAKKDRTSCGCGRSTKRGSYRAKAVPKIKRPQSYECYRSMMRRCHDSGRKDFGRYGALGIAVCDRWRFGVDGKSGFQCFSSDMGERPSKHHSVDRISNELGYEPPTVDGQLRRSNKVTDEIM